MNQFIKDCLSNIAKNSEAISAASQGINTAVIAILGYTAGQQDAQDCGAPIVWLKTQNGRPMPCNAAAVKYQENYKGKDVIVLSDGKPF